MKDDVMGIIFTSLAKINVKLGCGWTAADDLVATAKKLLNSLLQRIVDYLNEMYQRNTNGEV